VLQVELLRLKQVGKDLAVTVASVWRTRAAFLMALAFAVPADAALPGGCEAPRSVREASPADIRAFFGSQGKTVVTFLGYSGADYEDRTAMLAQARRVLEPLDPSKVIVNIGATIDGIGAVYEIAKARGFTTTGIVSTQARDTKATLSPCVDHVFFVRDETWGGLLPGQKSLSPTSSAMVDVTTGMVAIGGGDVARDELMAARAAGKSVQFIPSDMNHKIALERAKRRGEPVPTDFRGAARTAFGAKK
jgi:hypothetical protein